jgi:ABC-2 type transport system permease protein
LRLPSFAPASIPWLLAHELKLTYRARAKRGRTTLWIVAAVLAGLMLAVGLPLAFYLRHLPMRETPGLVMTLDMILLVVFTLILSQTLTSAVIGFYERGDLDLLLSSPLPPRRALTVRAVGIAMAPLLWFASLISIVVVPAAALGQPRWLTAYPVLIALALLASAAGMGLAMALMGLIGARRTRTFGQLLAAVIGAAFFLIGQLRNILPDHGRDLYAGIMRWADAGALQPGAPLSWPAMAVLGHPLPLAGLLGASALLFAAVTLGAGRRFAAHAGLAAGAQAGPARRSNRPTGLRGFQGGLDAALMRKELRLLLRDPTLLSQVLLRVLYVLPIGFAVVRVGADSRHGADLLTAQQLWGLAAAVAFVSGQLAGSLAWIVICAEDAPELLTCAPVDGSRVRRAKLAASMVPVAALLGPLLLALAWFSPWVGLCALTGTAASAVSAGLINLWFEKPAVRKVFRGRRTGSILVGVVEAMSGLGWGATTGVAASGSALAAIPLVVTIGLLALARALGHPKRGY